MISKKQLVAATRYFLLEGGCTPSSCDPDEADEVGEDATNVRYLVLELLKEIPAEKIRNVSKRRGFHLHARYSGSDEPYDKVVERLWQPKS